MMDPKIKEVEKENEESPAEEVTEASEPEDPKKNLSPKVIDSLPYPNRIKKDHDEKQYSKFLDMFRGLNINVPFIDILEQMPKYAELLKDLLRNKRAFKGIQDCDAYQREQRIKNGRC